MYLNTCTCLSHSNLRNEKLEENAQGLLCRNYRIYKLKTIRSIKYGYEDDRMRQTSFNNYGQRVEN